MKVYIVCEVQYCIGCAMSEAESLGVWAETYRTFVDAFNAAKERADEAIYIAYEGTDERDARTDEAMAELFGDAKPCDVTKEEASMGWSWGNCDHAYVWRIIESEV